MNELKAEKEENCAKNGKEGGMEEKREVVEGLVFRCVLYMGKPSSSQTCGVGMGGAGSLAAGGCSIYLSPQGTFLALV